jgi:hypothetical protein
MCRCLEIPGEAQLQLLRTQKSPRRTRWPYCKILPSYKAPRFLHDNEDWDAQGQYPRRLSPPGQKALDAWGKRLAAHLGDRSGEPNRQASSAAKL